MRVESKRNDPSPAHWLTGRDAIGERIAAKDWSVTALGPIEVWPQSLRTSLTICLALSSPSCLIWGTQRLQLYNHAYARLCGVGAEALGEDFAMRWSETWQALRSHFERAFRGEPSVLENQSVRVHRNEVQEAAIMTFTFAPVADEAGQGRGVLVMLLDPAAEALRRELQRANDELNQLRYTLSHDFRSPLRTLESMAQLVVDEHAPHLPAEALGLMNHISRGAARLAERADALLRFAQFNQQPLLRTRVDVASLVTNIVGELRRATPDRRVDVTIGELPAIDADPELLRVAFFNILSNAFKFTRNTAHARIEVGGRRQDRQVTYSIRDNGAGFDMKYAGRLFGLFQRMHGDAEFEGMGVGLALARLAMERHGGTLRAEARKGEGATLQLSLPS